VGGLFNSGYSSNNGQPAVPEGKAGGRLGEKVTCAEVSGMLGVGIDQKESISTFNSICHDPIMGPKMVVLIIMQCSFSAWFSLELC